MDTVELIAELRGLLDILEDVLKTQDDLHARKLDRLREEEAKLKRQIAYQKAVNQEIDSEFDEFRANVKNQADHIRQLIIIYSRRLQMLELNRAQQGISTPPAILMEIEDIKAQVEKLRVELQGVDEEKNDNGSKE